MPQDRATAGELLAGVEDFLRKDILPQLSGSSIYKCRVAANILSIVQRELALSEDADNLELEGLQKLLGRDGVNDDDQIPLDDLNAELCAKIRLGELDHLSDEIFAHVSTTVRAKLSIANPKYAGYREAIENG